jgi:hypothetical protein
MNTPVVLKQNGRRQRPDVTLNKETANALIRLIHEGKTLYPPEGYLKLILDDGETNIINTATLTTWCGRRNVIPETGEVLFDILNKARDEYRIKRLEKKKREIVEEGILQLHRTIHLKTKVPVIGMFGVVKDENGEVMKREDAKLLKIKMDNVQFGLERLDPDNFGKVDKTENKHLVFSLSDLRKAKEERDRLSQQP